MIYLAIYATGSRCKIELVDKNKNYGYHQMIFLAIYDTGTRRKNKFYIAMHATRIRWENKLRISNKHLTLPNDCAKVSF